MHQARLTSAGLIWNLRLLGLIWLEPPSESFQGGLGGPPLGRGLDSHSVASVCLWWGCPPCEEEFMEQDCINSSLGLPDIPFALVMSLTKS